MIDLRRTDLGPISKRISLGRSLHAASLSAFVGSAILAVMLCGVMILDESEVSSATGVAFLPIVGFIAGLLGLIAALPASLVIGAPLLWLLGADIQGRPRLYGVLLAPVGGVAGWIAYEPFFSGGLGAISNPARYACPLFGTVVAGLHPIILVSICREVVPSGAPADRSARL